MEIIKQIKAAETQAKEIIEKAKTEAVQIAEDFSKNRQTQQADADEKRRAAVGKAVEVAEIAAKEEVKQLMADGSSVRSEMEKKAATKIDAAATKVVANICQGQGTSD
jgi:vacuolar-type H+-ATPase subunit H